MIMNKKLRYDFSQLKFVTPIFSFQKFYGSKWISYCEHEKSLLALRSGLSDITNPISSKSHQFR